MSVTVRPGPPPGPALPPPAIDLTNPVTVMRTLAEIERDMAERQLGYERAANAWYHAKREQARVYARALVSSKAKTVTVAKAEAELEAFDVEGAAAEAEFSATKTVLDLLDRRAMILMSLLKAQGRSA